MPMFQLPSANHLSERHICWNVMYQFVESAPSSMVQDVRSIEPVPVMVSGWPEIFLFAMPYMVFPTLLSAKWFDGLWCSS